MEPRDDRTANDAPEQATATGSASHPAASQIPLPDELFLRPDEAATVTRLRSPLIRPLLFGAILGAVLGWPFESRPASPGLLLEKVLRIVDQRYVDPVDSEKLFHDGLNEMLRSLDPNSKYISAREVTEFEADTDGFFVGIGVVIEPARESRPPMIKAVLRGSPAERSGLVRGDHILEVSEENVETASLADVSRRIKGPPGSRVKLRLRRAADADAGPDAVADEPEVFETWVSRERVSLPSVEAVHLYSGPNSDISGSDISGSDVAGGDIGYVRLEQFQSGSTTELKRSLHNLVEAGATRFIIDLRGNRGGYLDEAVSVCDLFLNEQVVVTTKGRLNADKPEIYRTKGTTLFPQQPLVVLIDRGSASASEIVAAALQDHRRALLVGEESYGKWSVQDVIRLDPGEGILKLTTKSHHPPVGRWVRRGEDGHREGLVPNISVAVDRETRRKLQSEWQSTMLDQIETPYQVVRTERPSFDPPANGEEAPVVDAALARALGILSSESDYAQLIEIDPEPLAVGTGSDAGSQPRGSSADDQASVAPAVKDGDASAADSDNTDHDEPGSTPRDGR